MKIKVFFTNPTENVPVNNQGKMNSYIHKCLGNNNPYHDTFSEYAISSLQGGKFKGDGLSFEESEPYLVVSSENMDFISTFMSGVQKDLHEVFGMKFKRFEMDDFNIHEHFDKLITISPILLKNKDNEKITFENPEWIERLNEQSRMKLKHRGIEDPTFKIELRKPELGKRKLVWVGDVFNPASMVGLKVYGSKKARKTIYNLGFGNSTGCGFGSVKIYE